MPPNAMNPAAASLADRVRSRRAFITRALSLLERWDYPEADVPLLAPYDALRDAIGDDHAGALFRFTDREGRMLVLRGDVTPAVARQFAHLARERTEPIRLAYANRIARIHRDLALERTESYALGAELWGPDSLGADLEAIVVCLDLLTDAGLADLELHVGHVALQRLAAERLCRPADAQHAAHLADALSDRNRSAVARLSARATPEARDALLALASLAPGPEILEALAHLDPDGPLADVARRLAETLEGARTLADGLVVALDPGARNDRGYYTGLRFRFVCARTGETLAAGGRYDDLMPHFDAQCPAVGFGVRTEAVLERIPLENGRDDGARLVFDADQDPVTALAAARAERIAERRVGIGHSDRGVQ